MTNSKKNRSTDEVIDLALKKARTIEDLKGDLESEDLASSFSLDQALDPAVEIGMDTALDQLGISRADLNKHFSEPMTFNHTENEVEKEKQRETIKTHKSLDEILKWMSTTLQSLGGTFGSPTVARANSGRTKSRPEASSSTDGLEADRIWKQEGMILTLLSSGKRDFIITLRIEGEVIGKPVRLLWVDEASLLVEPSEPPMLFEFPIEQQDDGSYRVMIPAGIYSARMRAIIAAENRRDDEKIDARLLLPFVEID